LKVRDKDKTVSAILPLKGGKDVENIFVKKIRGRQYECRTIPFWAYNLSFADTLECGPGEDGEGLLVERVIKKSGNRTVRVGFKGPRRADHPEAVSFRDYLNKNHLGYEFTRPNLFAINVPSEDAYQQLTARLEEISPAAEMIWEDGDPQPGVALDGSDIPQENFQDLR
jgi:hypothetical protein